MGRLKEAKQTYGFPPVMVVLAVCLVVWCAVRGGTAQALGTPAGTVIFNTASVTYTLGGAPEPITAAASSSFDVLEVIDVAVTWQDATDVGVNTPHTDATLSFLITNTGNGPETFQLTTLGNLGGDDFDPQVKSLWLEVNGEPGLQTTGTTPDTLYQPGVNDPDLPGDGSRVIYLLADIPSGLNDGLRGRSQLIVQALTPGAAGAAPGTELAGQGLNGVNAVVGGASAEGKADGWYQVAAVTVGVVKSIAGIVDPDGGSEPYPGARLTYRIRVDVAGSGLARGLVISDAVPANTTYVAGTIRLDGAAQTDADDTPVDTSDYNVTATGTVTVSLGDVSAPAVRIIEFDTTIN